MAQRGNDKTIVAITKGERWEAKQIIKEGLELTGAIRQVVKKGDVVLLKPNLGYPEAPGMPPWTCTTDPLVLSALTELFLEAGAKRVLTADGPAHAIKGSYMFEASGIKEAVEKVGGEICPLDEQEYVRRSVPGGVILKDQWVPRICLEVDAIINVPKVKTTRVGKFTLGYKNMFGVVPDDERVPWHRIPEHFYFLVDLFKLIPPTFTVMDGLVIQEGLGPRFGTPVSWGVIVMGRDPVATEAVTVRALGHEPYEQMVLPIAEKAKQGTMDISRIDIRGRTIDAVQRYCKAAPGDLWLHPDPRVIEYCGGACWGCGLWIQYTPYSWEIDSGKTYALVVGVEPHLPDRFETDEVLVLGNCAGRSKKAIEKVCSATGIVPTFIGGCPPYGHRRPGYLKAHDIAKLPHAEPIRRVEG
jgi:uncharacterized protein (DUF362 family)